jgi:hypothetical protein
MTFGVPTLAQARHQIIGVEIDDNIRSLIQVGRAPVAKRNWTGCSAKTLEAGDCASRLAAVTLPAYPSPNIATRIALHC